LLAAIRRVSCQLASWGVETQLGELIVGEISQTKTKTNVSMRNAYFKVNELAVKVFFRETIM